MGDFMVILMGGALFAFAFYQLIFGGSVKPQDGAENMGSGIWGGWG